MGPVGDGALSPSAYLSGLITRPLKCGSGMRISRPQIMRNVLETPNHGRTVCISSVCRNHKAPTYFLDWYAGERYSVGMPYSRSSLEITEWVNLFSIRGEHPHDNGVAWVHFKGACQRRLFAMRTAHRHLLYGDDDEEESPI